MEGNTLKRKLDITAAIIALAFYAIDIILEIIGIVAIVELYLYSYYTPTIDAAAIVGIIIAITLLNAILSLAIKLLKRNPINKKGIRIAFLVVTSIMLLFLLISIISIFSVLSLLFIFCLIAIITLVSISIAQGENNGDAVKTKIKETAYKTKQNPTIEDKIAELKHLLELGVINEEQYETAVNKAVKEIM